MGLFTGLLDDSLLIEDRALLAADRSASDAATATVINTGGAGGLVALAGRAPARLRVIAVHTVVRDLDDPAGNIARIAAAARELGPDVTVRVEIPLDCPGYADAVAEAEAEGLQAVIRTADGPSRTAAQLGALVEADLAFAATVADLDQLLRLVCALDAVIDGADPAAIEPVLSGATPVTPDTVTGWDEPRVARVRRRLAAVRSEDPAVFAAVRDRGLG